MIEQWTYTHTKAKWGQMSRDDCNCKSSIKSTLVHLIINSTRFSEARFPDLYRDHESEKWDQILHIEECWGLESTRYQNVNWAQRVAVGSQEGTWRNEVGKHMQAENSCVCPKSLLRIWIIPSSDLVSFLVLMCSHNRERKKNGNGFSMTT